MKTKIINLASRPDRWQSVTKEVERFGIIDYERFDAYTGGISGFNKSMKEALRGERELLILEDDCYFTGTVDVLIQAKSILPDDWDMLYLGANVRSEQKHYKDNVWHLDNGWTTHAILYSDKGAAYCFEHFPTDIIYDEWLRQHQSQMKCFIIKPFLALQKPDRSDIWNNDVNYNLQETERYLL